MHILRAKFAFKWGLAEKWNVHYYYQNSMQNWESNLCCQVKKQKETKELRMHEREPSSVSTEED